MAATATWNMNEIELARTFADHFGFTVKGNWIKSPAGVPVACGWEHFAAKLARKGFITAGVGVDWRRAGETPRLGRVSRDENGYWI